MFLSMWDSNLCWMILSNILLTCEINIPYSYSRFINNKTIDLILLYSRFLQIGSIFERILDVPISTVENFSKLLSLFGSLWISQFIRFNIPIWVWKLFLSLEKYRKTFLISPYLFSSFNNVFTDEILCLLLPLPLPLLPWQILFVLILINFLAS